MASPTKIARGSAYWSNEVPSSSPDGRYLAFEHACSTWGPTSSGVRAADLMITDLHGNVVAEFPRDGWGFAWSPDSTRVAVWETFGRTIDVYGIDGKRQASLPLPRRMFPGYDSGPGVWMPDGSALLLYGVFVVPLDGSAPYDLSLGGRTVHCHCNAAATYSPDGTRIAVVSSGHSMNVVDAAGSPVSEVDAPLDSVEGWSPDGERFVSLFRGELYVVDVTSGSATMLPEARAALDGDEILGVRGFSPQGDRILYATGPGNGRHVALWSIGVDGSDARLLVAGTTQGEWLSR